MCGVPRTEDRALFFFLKKKKVLCGSRGASASTKTTWTLDKGGFFFKLRKKEFFFFFSGIYDGPWLFEFFFFFLESLRFEVSGIFLEMQIGVFMSMSMSRNGWSVVMV